MVNAFFGQDKVTALAALQLVEQSTEGIFMVFMLKAVRLLAIGIDYV